MKDTITYTNAGGGTVTWKRVEATGWWECQGCGRSGWASSYYANEHATSCRAR